MPEPTQGPDQPPIPGRARPPLLVLGLALALPLLTAIPDLAARAASRPDRVYGGFRWEIEDHCQYAAFARQVATGERALLLADPFAAGVAQRPSYLLPCCTLAGAAARVTGASLPAAWEGLRLASAGAFLLALWPLLGPALPERRARLLAWALVALSGGVPWLAWAAGFAPDGLEYPYLLSTWGVLLFPHWATGELALLAALTAALRGVRVPGRPAWPVGGLAALAWFLHPYTGNACLAALAAWAGLAALRRDRAELRARALAVAPALLAVLAIVVYLAWARQDEVFRRTSDNVFRWRSAIDLPTLPLAYGALLPLAGLSLVRGGPLAPRARDLFLAWLASAGGLSLLETPPGIKLQPLIHLPLAVLAGDGLGGAWTRLTRPGWRPALALGALLALGLQLPLTLARATRAGPTRDTLYLDPDLLAALRWLEQAPPGDVLCARRTGMWAAWIAGKPVSAGHWFLTPDLPEREDELARLLDPARAGPGRAARLGRYRYLVLGPHEQALAGARAAPPAGLRSPAFARGAVRIYALTSAEPGDAAPGPGR